MPDLGELERGARRDAPAARPRGSGAGSNADRNRLVRQGERLRTAPRLLLERRRAALDRTGARLQTLSPLATLDRGYAIVRSGGEACAQRPTSPTGRPLDIQLAAGSLGAHASNEVAPMSEEKSFEELQRELEEIVTRLERGDVPVDDAIALFRRGEELYKDCVARLARRRAPDRGARPALIRVRDTRHLVRV